MERMNALTCVDVVVDVPASRIEHAFTYLAGETQTSLGARVRVPFRGRTVGGWIVSEPKIVSEASTLLAIDAVDREGVALDPSFVRLADWMRRRYACSFRDAIAAVAGRGAVRSRGASYCFALDDSPKGDRIATLLFARFGKQRFSAIAARGTLRNAGERTALDGVLRELERLTRAGVLTRAGAQSVKATAPQRAWQVRPADLAAAKGVVQKRIAQVISENAQGMPLRDVARRARTTAANVRRAERAGVCAIEEVRHGGSADARRELTPTPEQETAIASIDRAVADGAVLLLHGVTGSGKTFVYARAIERIRSSGGKAIVLVPEIALTPQTAAHFTALYGSRVGVLHSGLSDGERARVWEDASLGALDVVVGARSAVFAPLAGLRMIVIDEEHEPSYKQDVAPRYDTAAVARERMRAAGGAVVLGSATPSLESYHEAKSGAIRYVRMLERATKAPLPPVEIVDMAQDGARGRRPLGVALVNAMELALGRGEKVLLFVNRRGYAGLLLCRACGFAPKCRRCAISLVVHTSDASMRCHVCGDAYKIAVRCPKCGSDDLKPFGFGTQRVEEEVRSLFPSARIVRMDSDTTGGRGSHGALLREFGSGADVLIGTQMIAKGLDFPTVTVVGVVAADIDLNRPDFRSAERTFSLLTQVAGRAGRAAPGARVVVQTYSPDHYAIKLAANHDYEVFAEKELSLRKELRYPPFGYLAYIGITGADARLVGDASSRVAAHLRSRQAGIEVLGPAPEPLSKARGEFRVRIALKSDDEPTLLEACAEAKLVRLGPRVRLTPIVDPR
jgi:primosomal protein N' (replication factor Y) (superfamily II helicase)